MAEIVVGTVGSGSESWNQWFPANVAAPHCTTLASGHFSTFRTTSSTVPILNQRFQR